MLATSDQSILDLEMGEDMEFLPYFSDPDFKSSLLDLISSRDISFVIPAHDDVALLFSEMDLPEHCLAVGQNAEINRIARFKSVTYAHLQDVVPVPRTWENVEDIEFPVFVKPDRGQGSKDSTLFESRSGLEKFLGDRDPGAFVFSEYLPGDEFTIDCFSHDGEVLFAGPRTRERTINGISTLSRSLDRGGKRQTLLDFASRISEHLDMHGLWFFQAKTDKHGELRLLEIAPRVSGTMMVNRAKGINFVELALWQACGHSIALNASEDTVIVRRTLDPHYEHKIEFERLLVDFDDTLVIDGLLNVPLMAMIFKAKNDRKPVILITKHQFGVLEETLRKFGIMDVFDEIHHLGEGDNKADYAEQGDLLVDDSFAERSSVTEKCVAAASLDMIEVYFDQ